MLDRFTRLKLAMLASQDVTLCMSNETDTDRYSIVVNNMTHINYIMMRIMEIIVLVVKQCNKIADNNLNYVTCCSLQEWHLQIMRWLTFIIIKWPLYRYCNAHYTALLCDLFHLI